MLASGEALDLGSVLLSLLIIVVAAKVAAEVAERLSVPAVLGEILAGILIGPSVLGLVDPGDGDTASMLLLLGEIGVLLLLLQVGMEMDLAELGKVGKASLLVAVVGVAVPFAGGALGAWGLGEAGKTAVFLGAALTATSVGITARVLGDLRALATTESRVVLGAAVADDVLGLVILTVVVKVVTEGSVGVGTVTSTIGLAIGFLVITGLLAVFVVPRVLGAVHHHARAGAAVLAGSIALMLAFAELADAAKLAFIIGAFMAGLAVGRSAQGHEVARDMAPIGALFIPVFFVGIGVNADLGAMARPSVLGLAAVLTVIGVVGKVIAGWAAVGTTSDRLLIGIGMIPRGEVGLIFASIGLSRGVLDADLYGALLIMVLVTTLVAPPLLRWRITRAAPGTGSGTGPGAGPGAAGATTAEPEGGWLAAEGGEVVLRGVPPVDRTVPLALEAAQMVRTGLRPGDALLGWFGAHRDAPLTWTAADTDDLLVLLSDGTPRSWRLLEVTGVLERALPEVHASVTRHRADPSELDILRSLRFPTVERVQSALADTARPAVRPYDPVDDPDGDAAAVLLLAAMVHDVVGADARSDDDGALIGRLQLTSGQLPSMVERTRHIAVRLVDSATRPESLGPAAVGALADELSDVRTLHLAGALARAIGEPTELARAELDELLRQLETRLTTR